MTVSPRATLTTLHRELVASLDRLEAPPEARPSGYDNLADVAQTLSQREREIGDRARLRHELAEVLDALDRVAAGTFGACTECGEAIGAARLRALPTTALCITCQEAHEAEARRQGSNGRPAWRFREEEDEE